MALKMPKADTGQPNSLLAQYNTRLLRRLTLWGGVAAFSLAVAVIVSQTEFGSKRLQFVMSAGDHSAPVAADAIVKPGVPALTDVTSAQLAAVESNTAATRAATTRLAQQVNKLTTESDHFTGRLANLEQQVDGITGSIKQQAEKAAAHAVAEVLPAKPAHQATLEKLAPVVGAPATAAPKLSLTLPPEPKLQDVAYTGAIKTPPKVVAEEKAAAKPQEAMAKADKDAKTATPSTPAEAKALPKLMPKKEKAPSTASILRAARAEALKVGAAAGKDKAEAKDKAKDKAKAGAKETAMAAKAEAEPTHKLVKMASLTPNRHRHFNARWAPQSGYGVDLGSADGVDVVAAQWAAVKANFGPMLAGMHPTAVRDHRLLSGSSFRLVIGRLPSLKAAEHLCARFERQQVSCSPIQFDGERVIWR